jgi:hypothetical protein
MIVPCVVFVLVAAVIAARGGLGYVRETPEVLLVSVFGVGLIGMAGIVRAVYDATKHRVP